jgi:rfaE bifunctional protein kinase chain/domain
MNEQRFDQIIAKYSSLRLAVVGDFCLDRYLEIDPARNETSIETGLEVYNIVNVRSQPGAAGTILNNLVALGVGEIRPVGFCGEDGEGYELLRALKAKRNVQLDHFLQTPERRTFTYCKPLVLAPGRPPRELNRLDSKNWSATPERVWKLVREKLQTISKSSDAIIFMDQVDVVDTGVITSDLREAIRTEAEAHPDLLMLADSRRSLKSWPPVCLKMNQSELLTLMNEKRKLSLAELKSTAAQLARAHGRSVFITLSERGIIGADPSGTAEHVPGFPVQGEIDIVGAGDAVTANLTAALAAGATLREALELAMAAASIVIHQLGTTGTAGVEQIRSRLFEQSAHAKGQAHS